MQRKKNPTFIVIASLVVVLGLLASVFLTIGTVNKKLKQECFDDLAIAAQGLSSELSKTMTADRTLLRAAASNLAFYDIEDDNAVLTAMADLGSNTTYMTYFELLDKNNRLLCQDGSVLDTSGSLNFNTESTKGDYLSGKTQGIYNPEGFVVRASAPVVKNGETVAILYGVISLSKLAEVYKTDMYKNNALTYLIDGSTGDFLINPGDNTIGSIVDFKGTELLPGYSYGKAVQRINIGEGGILGFVSSFTGENMFLYHMPTGINNWSVAVCVPEHTAFENSAAIISFLVMMAEIEGIILLVYMGCILVCFLNTYYTIRKMGTEDPTTTLQNRVAFDKYTTSCNDRIFPSVACIYIDANGLHEINNKYGHAAGDLLLCAVGISLMSVFPYKNVYRIGGDEFVVLCENTTLEECSAKLDEATKMIELREYGISSGLVFRENEMGLDRVISEADEKMLANKRAYYRNLSGRKPR